MGTSQKILSIYFAVFVEFAMRAIDELRAFHARHVAPIIGPPIGASESDVQSLERALGASMPADYREFLLWFGADYKGVLQGSDCFVNQIVANTEALPELLEDNGMKDLLPPNYVSPFMHQGYIAAWFAVPADEDDPPAFSFNEGQVRNSIESGKTIMQLFLQDIVGIWTHRIGKTREKLD